MSYFPDDIDSFEEEMENENSCDFGAEFCEDPQIKAMGLCTTECKVYFGMVKAQEEAYACGMKDCNRPSVETLEIDCHPDLRADIGLPPEIVKLSVCVRHALMWKIGWLFAEYEIGVTSRNLKRFIFRMMAEASER